MERHLWHPVWHARFEVLRAVLHMVQLLQDMLEASWNVMAHAQKPDFIFRRNGRVQLNRRGRHFSRLLAAEVRTSALIVGSNAGYTMFWGSEKGTGYPLHLPVSASLPLPCVTVCHHILPRVYCIGCKSHHFSKNISGFKTLGITHSDTGLDPSFMLFGSCL
jgi:hypothetical protein